MVNKRDLRIELREPFFPRSALAEEDVQLWVGRDSQVHRIVRGLLASPNARYLITGYPGVGKTSFIARVFSVWRRLASQRGITRLLVFDLRFVQPESPDRVVRKIIGKVYFGSRDGQFAPDKILTQRLQLSFVEAFAKEMTEVQREAETHSSGLEAGSDTQPLGPVVTSRLRMLFGKTRETIKSIEIQREYSLDAALNDLESILGLLNRIDGKKRPRLPMLRRSTSQRADQTLVLFVFDQMDDLASMQALSCLYELQNASFIVLGGMKLREQMDDAHSRGISVLGGFQDEYLPCLWNCAEELLSRIVVLESVDKRIYALLCDYINYRAQGLPRRAFAALDEHVQLQGDQFYLCLNHSDMARVRLCARVHRILWRNRQRILGEHIDSVKDYHRDKALRGMYHLVDRILRVIQFSFGDATAFATSVSRDIMYRHRQRVLSNILAVLVEESLVVRQGDTYSLSDAVLRQVKQTENWLLDGFADAHEWILSETTETQEAESAGVAVGGDLHGVVLTGDANMVSDELRSPLLRPASDRYRIVRELGRGGQASVLLAEDSVLNRLVVLKVYADMHGTQSAARSRFYREAKRLAFFRHPNIVQVYDIVLIGDSPALVTEYVEGQDLKVLLSKRSLAPSEVMRIGLDIGQALEEIHKRGVVHRDIKPSNIMITEDGSAILTDFGLARLFETTEDLDITQGAPPPGTPAYMAPEQLLGIEVDARADIYALGIVLYEALAGRHPFRGDAGDYPGMLHRVAGGDPPEIAGLNGNAERQLGKVIMRCLKGDPNGRFQSAEDLLREMQEIR